MSLATAKARDTNMVPIHSHRSYYGYGCISQLYTTKLRSFASSICWYLVPPPLGLGGGGLRHRRPRSNGCSILRNHFRRLGIRRSGDPEA